jgi:hypothetical protein
MPQGHKVRVYGTFNKEGIDKINLERCKIR